MYKPESYDEAQKLELVTNNELYDLVQSWPGHKKTFEYCGAKAGADRALGHFEAAKSLKELGFGPREQLFFKVRVRDNEGLEPSASATSAKSGSPGLGPKPELPAVP